MTPTDPVAVFVALCVAHAKWATWTADTDLTLDEYEAIQRAAYDCDALRVNGCGERGCAWRASLAVIKPAGFSVGVCPLTNDKHRALAALEARFPGIGAAALSALPARPAK